MIFDFRLKVFITVAKKLSFTKAANELFISQPAVTKHINELEHQLHSRLFTRNGNTISLTPAGQVLLKHAEQIFKHYAALENEIAQLTNTESGILRIGASTTLAQYVLPRILAIFKTTHPSVQITFLHGNSEFIEQQIIDDRIDIGLVEGISHHPQINYESFVKDEIVLVMRTGHRLFNKSEIKQDQLMQMPLAMREQGSGTLDVIYEALHKISIHPKQLNIEVQLDSTESIKQYIMYTDCGAFLSIHSITKELQNNELTIIDIKGIDITRTFQFIDLHGQNKNLPILFKRFCTSHYNFK